jgi:hypothetical protein
MYIEAGGAPSALFSVETTPQPDTDMFLDTTPSPYDGPLDSTVSPPGTYAPSWGPTTAIPNAAAYLEQIGLRLISFGRSFEKAAFDTTFEGITTDSPLETTAAAIDRSLPSNIEQVNPHQYPAQQTPDQAQIGAKAGMIEIDPNIFMSNNEFREQIEDLLRQKNLTISGENLTDTCHVSPFPFCGDEGCSTFGMTIYAAIQILLLVLIVASNITIISVINDMNRNNRGRTSKSNNIFKLSLAIADLFLGLSILPGGIQQSVSALIDIESFGLDRINFLPLEKLNTIPAIIFGAGAVISTVVGIWSILLMKIDLFLRIKFPMRHHTGSLMNTTRARITVIVTWLAAIGLVAAFLPMDISFTMSPVTLTYAPAVFKFESGNSIKILIYAAAVWGLPFLMTIPLGAYLLHTIAAARRKLHLRSQASYIKRHADHIERRQRNRRDWEAACRILTVELVYVFTFLPIIISHVVLYKYGQCNKWANMVNFISLYILIAGSFVNLFVYHLMWKDFQVKLRSLFCGKSQQARSEQKTQISTINSGTLDNHNSTQITVTFEIPSQ